MKTKVWMWILVVVLLLLLIPIPMRLKDGGTVVYRAVLYSVSKVHRLCEEGSSAPYVEGVEIEILGFQIYSSIG